MNILLLLVGLGLILAGANYLTDGAAAIAQRFRVPEFVVGLTVVAVGTSTPELVVSVLSAIAHNSGIAVGNVVGSNLFNVFVILGICALIRPLALSADNIRRDIPFGLGASILLFVFASDKLLHLGAADRIGRGDGIAMLLLYAALMGYTIRNAGRNAKTPENAGHDTEASADTGARKSIWLTVAMIVGGLAGLVFGGELFLHHATVIARKLGVSESVIAITLVAGGTSLPELASSAVSIAKGKAGMALGNVLGSNATNILLILGVSATIHPLDRGGITTLDLGMVVLSSLLLFIAAFTFRRRSIDRWEGAVFLTIYAAYIWYLIR
ncbi:MAG: calcium/sodium antiporter [Alistipes sp.]|nr:calcium/sodium antiporter [Alistipes sp.]